MNEQARAHDFGLYFWIHATIIVGIWTSPFWLSWNWLLVAIGIYYLQLGVWGDCVLTAAQFGTRRRERSFYQHYLEKMGFRVNGERLIVFLDLILPWLLLATGILLQQQFAWMPLVY